MSYYSWLCKWDKYEITSKVETHEEIVLKNAWKNEQLSLNVLDLNVEG